MKKNDIIRLEITDMGVNGEGIGRAGGCAFFVKDALPGDTVDAVITKMNKSCGFAKTVSIVTPSADRVEPVCPDAARCGGCQIMQLSYRAQLKLKEDKVRNDLIRLGGQDPEALVVRPIIGMSESDDPDSEGQGPAAAPGNGGGYVPCRFRNKAQFPVGRDRGGRVITGFYAGRTHYIIGTEKCLICQEPMDKLTAAVREFIAEEGLSVYDEKTGRGLVRHILIRESRKTGQVMVCLVINGNRLQAAGTGKEGSEKVFEETGPVNAAEKRFADKLLAADISPACITSICLNENRKNTNVILGDKVRVLYGNGFIEDRIGDLTFRISPLSFYQINSVQTEKLYGKALEYAGLTGNETVWDLYCGTGTISLFLAREAKRVYGVEIVPEAIENARTNAELNGITNAEFFCGNAEEVFPKMYAPGACIKDNRGEMSGKPAGSPPGAGEAGTPAHSTKAGRQETKCVSITCGAEHPDVVVVDPPRKGCDEALLEAILRAEPERIVYVSCNSATLARDVKILGEKYTLTEATPVDMFPHTVHVETVVLMSRIDTQ